MKATISTAVLLMALATSECSSLREGIDNVFGPRTTLPDEPTVAENIQNEATTRKGAPRFRPITAEDAGLVAESLKDLEVLLLLPIDQIDEPGDLHVYPRGASYSASGRLAGADLQMMGMKTKGAPSIPCPPTGGGVSPANYLVQHTDYGVELSFNWCGAAYNIAMQCDTAKRDQRCNDNNFILSIYRTLRQVGP